MKLIVYGIPVLLIFLSILGWGYKHRWARVLAIILLVFTVASVVAIGLYVYAIGQADWSN